MRRRRTQSIIDKKRARLDRGEPLRVMDLFAGCGGLSLGFHAADFEITAAVENDPLAAESHARNFWRHAMPEIAALHARPHDITTTEPADLLRHLKVPGRAADAIDVVIGGPPCQAFARVGRAKLREVDEHPEAYKQDPRSNLYLRYLHYVRALQPLVLLMENVPDVLNFGGHNISDEVCEVLEEEGFVCAYTLLNSAFYGVPQMRERMFLLAFRRELADRVSFPEPTHWIDLPVGYHGTRQVALQVVKKNGFDLHQSHLAFDSDQHWFLSPPKATADLPPAVTTKEALQDLPVITAHLSGQLRRGARRFLETIAYPSGTEPTAYGRLMRTWPGFEGNGGVCDHVIRSLPRDYAIFRRMQPGDQYPEAHALALEMCEQERRRRRIDKKGAAYRKLKAEIVPPYDPDKFPNKWRKLEAFTPSRTLMAHLSKDSYSHIHYDSDQARTISVREAARLQSFPDGFIFAGTMNPAFRQIGNAVPPLVANLLAHAILRQLGIHSGRRPLVELATTSR